DPCPFPRYGRDATWCRAGARECCRQGPIARRTTSRLGADRPSRGRCAMIRPLSCGPWVAPFLSLVPRFRGECTSLLVIFLVVVGFRRRRLFCPLLGRLCFGGFRSTSLHTSFRLNLGRGRQFRRGFLGRRRFRGLGTRCRLAPLGEDLGDADHRQLLTM